MEEGEEQSWQASLKAPVIEVVDLLSDEEEAVKPLDLRASEETRDALGEDLESDEDSQSEDSQWSLYEELLQRDEEDNTLHESMASFLANSLAMANTC